MSDCHLACAALPRSELLRLVLLIPGLRCPWVRQFETGWLVGSAEGSRWLRTLGQTHGRPRRHVTREKTQSRRRAGREESSLNINVHLRLEPSQSRINGTKLTRSKLQSQH